MFSRLLSLANVGGGWNYSPV